MEIRRNTVSEIDPQLPERWAFLDEVPKTSVGKYDKKRLRGAHADGNLEVIELLSA